MGGCVHLQTLCPRPHFPGEAGVLFLWGLFCHQSVGGLHRQEEAVNMVCWTAGAESYVRGFDCLPFRWTCKTFFFTSFTSSNSLKTQFRSWEGGQRRSIFICVINKMLMVLCLQTISLDLNNDWWHSQVKLMWTRRQPVLNIWKHCSTIVFPAPLGPTMMTELLSPWTAVLLRSSRRCLKDVDNAITHCPHQLLIHH